VIGIFVITIHLNTALAFVINKATRKRFFDSSMITLEDVKVWFFETEKLIRTTANLSLEVTSQQGINQLRYAAHHILKSNKQEDTIEAYKHCKRAYYDTLDLFILTLNDRFVTSLVVQRNAIG
jgi:hypothetical protein